MPILDSREARLVRRLRELAEYARSLETEIDGMTGDPEDAAPWGGSALVAADATLADYGDPCDICDMDPHSPQCPKMNTLRLVTDEG